MFRISVAGKMRFAKQIKTCDTRRTRKLMPLWRSHDGELKFRNHLLTNCRQNLFLREFPRIASIRIHDPLDAGGQDWSVCVR